MQPQSTPHDAVCLLQVQMARGEQLLEAPIDCYESLTMANAERSVWSLTNKKLLHTLLGDSTMLMRGTGALDQPAASRLDEDQAHFRRLVSDQLAVLERVQLRLLKMA